MQQLWVAILQKQEEENSLAYVWLKVYVCRFLSSSCMQINYEMECVELSLAALRRKIDDVQRFLSIALRIANAHTVDFYTRNIWNEFIALSPADVLSQFNDQVSPCGTPEKGKLP